MIAGLIAMTAGVALMALVRPQLPRTAGAKGIYVVLGIVIAAYAGLRDGDLVNDYTSYVTMYETDGLIIEPTFILITAIVKNWLGDNVLFLFLIYAAIAVALKLRAIETLSSFAFLSVMIWLSDTFPLHELTQMRTAVATGFFLLSIKPLYERDGLRFFVLILCATLFHISAIAAFALWLMRPGRINKPFWVGAIVVGYALALWGFDIFRLALYMPVPYIREKVEMYLELQRMTGDTVTPFGMSFMGKMVLTLFLLWRAERIASQNRYAFVMLKIMFVSFILLLVFSTNLAAGLRFHEFFRTVEILLFPLLCFTVRPRFVAWVALVVLAAVILTVQITGYELILPSK